MQDAPDRETILAGVAMFLAGQVEPAVKAGGADAGLAFRCRVAAHLVAMVGRELAFEAAHDGAELARLQALLGVGGASVDGAAVDGAAVEGAARRAAIGALRAELARRLRSDGMHGTAAVDASVTDASVTDASVIDASFIDATAPDRTAPDRSMAPAPIDEAAARAALMQTLREQLQVVQPRFDTRIDLPEEEE